MHWMPTVEMRQSCSATLIGTFVDMTAGVMVRSIIVTFIDKNKTFICAVLVVATRVTLMVVVPVHPLVVMVMEMAVLVYCQNMKSQHWALFLGHWRGRPRQASCSEARRAQ